MLNELPKEEEMRIFNEIQKIETLNWISKEESNPFDYVETVSENMMIYKTEDWLRGNNLVLDYDADIIRNCLSSMNTSNFFVILTSKLFQNDFNQEEKWMQAKYRIEDLTVADLKTWSSVSSNDSLAVPASNKYLAEDTTLKLSEPSREWSYVKKIEENQFGELFFKADSTFDLPRGFIILLIRSDIIRENPKNSAMFDFFPFILARLMAEIAYDAETADLTYSFDADW